MGFISLVFAGLFGRRRLDEKGVFGKDLQSVNTYYYWYAESNDGAVWSGPFNTCVPQSAYEWCINTCCSPTCRTVGFREKYIGGNNNYTINLVK
ncbi:MAG: hypothetical protein FD172_1685 [Methylocystaceae bacterium]|nr:MAG: hypothetical protein FD172_1685 [Methylocystaceae bacterium]